jgi:hypothetical protein
LVDGKGAGSISYHETIEIPIEPERHSLRLRAGRYSSQERSFGVADGDSINFRCHGGNIWPIYARLCKPVLAISLKRE